jgi:RND family efflux transporter MFP subunit
MTQKKLPKSWLPLAAVALGTAIALPAAALVAARFTENIPEEAPASPALGVSVLRVENVPGYELRRVFTGRVEANRTSGLGFERSGLLKTVLVLEGAQVAAGEVVARLDTALIETRRRELTAALASAQADLALAEATLNRYRESVDQGAVTRQSLDEAREGARAAKASVELAEARIASLDLDLEKSELCAPFDGVVTARLADEGRVLAAGSPVLELQERATPEIRVGVAGPLADGLTRGETYEVDWRGRLLHAELRALLPVRAQGTRTLDALFVPLDAPAALHPGELVELRLTQQISQPGFWLPVSALAEGTRGLWQTYALEPLAAPAPPGMMASHRVAPRPLELLYQEGDQVYVQGPLGDGEQLVRSGLQRVVPGQLVRLLREDSDQIAMGGR